MLGLAGTNVGSYKQRLAAILPFAASLIESDALIALEGAIGGHDGAIAILGTGSAYLARQAGVLRPLGGWGFVVGDLGSGARLGRALLEATLLLYDRIRPATALTEAVLARFGGEPGAVVDYAVAAKPRDFGAFAPLVFEFAGAGDALADALIRQSVADVEATFDAINLRPTDWLCTLGGLAEPLSARFSARYKVSAVRGRGSRMLLLGGSGGADGRGPVRTDSRLMKRQTVSGRLRCIGPSDALVARSCTAGELCGDQL